MATKRAICPFCNLNRIPKRFFPVNPDAAVVYCPNCLKEMTPAQAIKTYTDAIDVMVKKADETLFVGCDPVLAYQQYADVLEVEPNAHAYLGRMVCMLYLSKVRKSYIAEVGILLDEEIDSYFHRAPEIPNLVSFLKRINRIVDEYEYAVHKKLTFRNYFYDIPCLELYLTHVNEVLAFKTAVLNECNFIRKKYNNEEVEVLINLLENSIKEKTYVLKNEKHVTVDGKSHVFEEANKVGIIKTKTLTTKPIDTRMSRFRMASLDINNKKCRYITNIVFKDYSKMIKSSHTSFIFMFLFLILGLISLGLGFYFKDIQFFGFLAGIIFAGVNLILTLVMLGIHISLTNQVKKRRLQIH